MDHADRFIHFLSSSIAGHTSNAGTHQSIYSPAEPVFCSSLHNSLPAMDPRFLGQSESADWMSLGTDISYDSNPSTFFLDIGPPATISEYAGFLSNAQDDGTSQPPTTLEAEPQLSDFEDYAMEASTDREPPIDWNLFDIQFPL